MILKHLVTVFLLLGFSTLPSLAHDANELTTRIFLRTNSLELQVTVAAETALLLAEADGYHLASLSDTADVAAARPSLGAVAGALFKLSAAGQPLVALATNVALTVEDHIELKLIYPRPAPGTLRCEAVHLKKLPADVPYGAMVTAVDLATDVFLGQKLLTSAEPVIELNVSAPAAPLRPGVPRTAP